MNPANYEAWIDPEGGEWIRLKHGACEGVVWRPADMEINEDGLLNFKVELFEGPGIPEITEENSKVFGNFCKGVITDILGREAAEMEALAESFEEKEEESHEEEVSDGGIILQTNPWGK